MHFAPIYFGCQYKIIIIFGEINLNYSAYLKMGERLQKKGLRQGLLASAGPPAGPLPILSEVDIASQFHAHGRAGNIFKNRELRLITLASNPV